MKRDSVIQFLKFSIVGLSNTIVSYLVYAALLFIGVNYIVANIVSYFAGVINSFYWNNKYVFDYERSDLSSLISSSSVPILTGFFLAIISVIIDITNASNKLDITTKNKLPVYPDE